MEKIYLVEIRYHSKDYTPHTCGVYDSLEKAKLGRYALACEIVERGKLNAEISITERKVNSTWVKFVVAAKPVKELVFELLMQEIG